MSPALRRRPLVAVAALVIAGAAALVLLPSLAGARSTISAAEALSSAERTAATRQASTDTELSIVDAVILGAVEGITEYLPVSSTGHLLVTERLLGIGTGADKAATDTYTVVIQLGAILAVLGIFWKRFLSMAEGVIGRDDDGRNTLISVVVAFVPAGIIGKLFGDTVKEHLLNPTPVAITWIVGGVVILAFVANQSKLVTRIESVSDIGVRNAAIIGVAQTLALVPGTSRSFVTILAAMLLGVSLTAAVEFSFLLGFVTLSAATALELVDNGSTMFDTFGVAAPIVGIIVAGVTAFLSVKFMIEWLSSRGLGVFGWYRIAAGVITLALVAADRI